MTLLIPYLTFTLPFPDSDSTKSSGLICPVFRVWLREFLFCQLPFTLSDSMLLVLCSSCYYRVLSWVVDMLGSALWNDIYFWWKAEMARLTWAVLDGMAVLFVFLMSTFGN